MAIARFVMTGILIVSLFGCAVMFNGTTQQVNLSSIPPGAIMKINGVTTVTPSSVELKRGKNYNVYVEKDGCLPVQSKIKRVVSGKILFDLFWLPYLTVIFGFIDFASGGAYKLEPVNLNVTLQCEK